MKLKSLTSCGLVFLACYAMSYVIVSTKGFYEPIMYGLVAGRDGQAILAPKSFGYQWLPCDVDTESGYMEVRWVTLLYLPILSLDRAFWHTRDRVHTLRYRTKNYSDIGKLEYLDIR